MTTSLDERIAALEHRVMADAAPRETAFDIHLESMLDATKDWQADDKSIPCGAPLHEILPPEEQEKIREWAANLMLREFYEVGDYVRQAFPESRQQHLYALEAWAVRNAANTITFLRSVAVMRERVEERLAALEARAEKSLAYAGVWGVETHYPAGSVVTHRGGLWISSADTRGMRPGDGNGFWKLAVKSGGAR